MNESHSTFLQQARDPATAPAQLRALATHEDATVRQAVTRNPRTPTHVLLQLAAEFPQAFVENPSLVFLRMVDLKFMTRLSLQTVRRILTLERLPDWFWFHATHFSHTLIRSEVASDRRIPEKFLKQLVSDKAVYVRVGCARNPLLPGESIERLARDNSIQVRCHVAANERTSVSVLRELAKDPSARVRNYVANNSHTPLDCLQQLEQDSNLLTRKAAIEQFAKGEKRS